MTKVQRTRVGLIRGSVLLAFGIFLPVVATRSFGADGDLDPRFRAQGFSDTVVQVLPLADGRVLVGGQFDFANRVLQPKIAALLPNGDLRWGYCLLPPPEGTLFAGGVFDLRPNIRLSSTVLC